MASSSSSSSYAFFCIFLLLSFSNAQTSSQLDEVDHVALSSDAAQRWPKALLLPVLKDAATNQYVTTINKTTPIKLVVDIGGRFLSANGSTYRSAHTSTAGELAEEVLSMQSTDGSNPGPPVEPRPFIFNYSPTTRLPVLPHGAQGSAGLGRTRNAFPSQVAAAFSLRRQFAVCLSSSTSSNGAIFFGDGPYVFHPRVDASTSLIHTPLVIKPVSTAGNSTQGEPSGEYFIGVTSIKVNKKMVALNSTLLSIASNGVGGTKLSSINPYTTLERSIYKAVADAFIKESNLTRVASVAPFGVCFSSKNVGSTRVGPAVSKIDLVLQNESVKWTIFGANSVVAVNKDLMCLALLDGGLNPGTSIVIGGYQLEDTVLQFDLAASRLGFSSSLLLRGTTCASFNYTSIHG